MSQHHGIMTVSNATYGANSISAKCHAWKKNKSQSSLFIEFGKTYIISIIINIFVNNCALKNKYL